MSTHQNLFKEAIADAKAVREAALTNAKAALEEALTPKLQSMLAAKLNEMEEDDLDEDNIESSELDEDFDISEILAELDEESKEPELDEAKKEESEESESEEEDETKEEESEETEEEKEVKDMSVEELENMIKDIIAQELGNTEETPVEDEIPSNDVDMTNEPNMGTSEEEIDLDELLAELDALDETDENDEDEIDEAKKPKTKEKIEMDEAINTIKILRKELNEQNLLNAKLLYVNKLFKAKNLTETQKIQVITSFDKARTITEAKTIFETLKGNLNTVAKKTTIRESLGFASKASGIAPKKQIVESNDVITRMQKLANIIK